MAEPLASTPLDTKLARMYPQRQTPCKNPARAEAKRIAAKEERRRRRRAQKRAG